MTKYLTVLMITISLSLNAQNEIHQDSTVEAFMINGISGWNLMSLNVCDRFSNCKGFLTEKDTSGTTLHQMDVRAIISKIADFQFKIQYKYRESKLFIEDTFHIYCLNNSICIAYPIDINNNATNWDFIPSSNDEREVAFVLTNNDEIILYKKLK